MHIIRDFEHCEQAQKGAVVALGNFDGVHRGHQAILRICLEQAKKRNAMPAVMTFEPHPREFFAKTSGALRIYPLHKKLQIFADAGMSAVFLARFNHALASHTAQEFVEEILVRQLAVRHVITGYNFAFGKGRQGNTDFLEDCAKRYGFGFTHIEPVADKDDGAISSTAIRALLKAGETEKASRLLGRPYTMLGRVKKGDGRGKMLGFPTANISLEKLFLPRFGIYAARLAIANEAGWHDAVANLGIRPMFVAEKPLLEVHCLGLRRDLYGRRVEVELVQLIRDEQTFGNNQALSEQIAADCASAEAILKRKGRVAYG